MRPLIICCFFMVLGMFAKAQSFAIINDKDGFVNVRKEPNVKSAIVGKLYVDDIFGVDEDDNVDVKKLEWLKIYKQDEHHGLQGYIHASRNFFLSNFKTIRNLRIYSDSCVCRNDSLTVTIKSAHFKAHYHKLSYTVGDKTQHIATTLDKIDGNHIWGTDGGMPKRAITSLKVIIDGFKIDIPKKAFDDLYEPNYSTATVYLGINNTIYIKMDNSDGAGGYAVIWIIKNGKYLKRYIDNSYT